MYFKSSKYILKFLFFICLIYLTNSEKFINEFVVQVQGGYSEAISVAKQMGFIVDHKMIGFDDLFVFKYNKKGDNVHKFYKHRVKRSNKVNFIEQQIAKKRVKRGLVSAPTPYIFTDPLYPSQWYLMRSRDQPDLFDMNVIEAWQLGYTGKGVVVCILDDGIDYRHPDLSDNYDPNASYDINGKDNDPLPNYNFMDNRHGTRCAGEVAAKVNNSKCGVGIAYNSRIGAVRMLDGEVTDRVEAEALSFKQQYIDIYSGSWGPDDNGQKVEGPARFAKESLEKGAKYGRKGLGNIYVWASGNGGNKYDSCACDGYVGSIYTLSVSSVSELNRKPWYLESCASTLISTYSSGGADEKKVISTDLNGNCATDHTGTSASAPLAAGIIAILLEANANLTWRDVQYITVITANPLPFTDGNFITNGANRKVSNLYGFGLMDTTKMVRLGLLWQTLPPQHICKSETKIVNKSLSGVFVEIVDIVINGCPESNVVNYLEHVILYLSVEYRKRGDLQVFLISPSGTRSEILPTRQMDHHSGNTEFDKWPLMSVQFWGEKSKGKWSLELRNIKSSEWNMNGLLKSFSLELYGTEKFPVRIRPPSKTEPNNWFQQFERFVVYDSNVTNVVTDAFPIDVLKDSNSVSESLKIKCHSQCSGDTCKGWGPQNCYSCMKYKTHDGFCVSQCPVGSYLDVFRRVCEPCHFSCDECTGQGPHLCTRCNVGDVLTKPFKECQAYVKNCSLIPSNTSSCIQCPDNCSVCHSKTLQCSQCQPGFVLTLYNQCRPECDPGSYADWRGRCRSCHSNCLTCVNGNPYECTSCDRGSFLLPMFNNYKYGTCLPQCEPSYFTNNITRQCFRCHSNCKTCTGPFSHMCIDCIPPMTMSRINGTCTDQVFYNCSPDQYRSANGTCEKCPSSCKSCSSNGQCTKCSKVNRFQYNNVCVNKCPVDHFSISGDNVCLPCKVFCDPCNSTGSKSYCNTCAMNTTQCSNKCNHSEYWNVNSKSCKSCHPSCSRCIGGSPNDCTNCFNTHDVLSAQKCSNRCSVKEYIFRVDTSKVCLPCHLSCKDQLCDPVTGACLRCPDGHGLNATGRCQRIITCPMSTYIAIHDNDGRPCKLCNQSCRSCWTGDQYCASCHSDHCLHPQHSTCHPCCSPFSTNKNCFKCIAGREFCEMPFSETKRSINQFYVLVVVCACVPTLLLLALCVRILCQNGIVTMGCVNHSSMKYSVLTDKTINNTQCDSSSQEDQSDSSDTILMERPLAHYISPSSVINGGTYFANSEL